MTRRTIPLALAVAALAACGGSQNQSGTAADSAAAVGPSVDSVRNTDDSSYVKAQQRLDSLREAGVGPADGIDSAASRAGNTLTNDPTADTMVYRKMRVPPKAKP